MGRLAGTDRFSGLLRIGFAGVIWGTIPLFVRMLDASPFVVVFWRVVFGAAAVLIYLLVRRRMKELARLGRRSVLSLLAVGALLAANWVLFFGAFYLTRVAVVELLAYVGPVFVAALGPLTAKEPYDRRIVPPLTLALGGTALIIGLGELSLEGSRSYLGAGMAFATALCYCGLMLTGKRLLASIPAPVIAFGEYVFAALLLLPAVFLLPGPSSAKEWGALATLGVVHTTFAILIFFSGLRLVRADHAAVFTYAEPVTGVMFAAIFLSEPLGWATAVGGAAVIAAGVLVARMSPSTGMEAPGVAAAGDSPVLGE
ncbi:MAG: hypothetical protein A2133_04280 [Actinobacteria bacterium RBG_16_64_13]|nr:MAG: hypothetical protein A2133_04280 [Actinobacteria bacterium RBG_16_64_13]